MDSGWTRWTLQEVPRWTWTVTGHAGRRTMNRTSSTGCVIVSSTTIVETRPYTQGSPPRRPLPLYLILLQTSVIGKTISVAVVKKADRTAYDTRCRCKIEPPKMPHLEDSGGFRLGPGGTGPSNLAQPLPQFLIGSMVISLSRCCLPNDEGPGPQVFFS